IAMVTLYVGTAACALSLGLISAGGFAPDGRPPLAAVALLFGGALLVAIRPRHRAPESSPGSSAPVDPGRKAA
ncbi:MAG: hypothetical protein K0U70_11340, partial [Actinomycetia bacterium]|nr:hypothetical protein [Actinomycetes bacterium]